MSGGNITSKVRAAIDKWLLDDTQHKLADAGIGDTPANHLCFSVIPVAHTYCRAVLDLVDKAYVLPAMALLRALAELTLRTVWCLGETDESVEVKINRWLKRSYTKEKELLQDMLDSEWVPDEDKEGFKQNIEELTELIEKIPHGSSGPVTANVKELPILKERCTHLYTTMHRAVHPDLVVLSSTIKEEGGEHFSLGDWRHVPKSTLALSCLDLAFQLTVHIQAYQELETDTTKTEYKVLRSVDS